MLRRADEVRFFTEEEVSEGLATALRILEAHDLTAELQAAALEPVLAKLLAKHVTFEEVGALGIRGLGG